MNKFKPVRVQQSKFSKLVVPARPIRVNKPNSIRAHTIHDRTVNNRTATANRIVKPVGFSRPKQLGIHVKPTIHKQINRNKGLTTKRLKQTNVGAKKKVNTNKIDNKIVIDRSEPLYILTNNIYDSFITTDKTISCVMPTKDRQIFAKHAIKLFEMQSYKDARLFIIDDGKQPLFERGTELPASVYMYIRKRPLNSMSLPSNMIAGIQHSKDPLIAVWEDDDWYHKDRLKYQVEHIGSSQAHGISYSWYYHIMNRRYKLFNHPRRASNCATMIRRTWFDAHEYPSTKFSDLAIWRQIADKGTTTGDQDKPLFVGIKHNIGIVAGGGHKGFPNSIPDLDGKWLKTRIDGESFKFYESLRINK